MKEFTLFTPGPTILPPGVLHEMSKQPLYHKSTEFKQLLHRVEGGLRYVFQTKEHVIPLVCSGTGAGEAVMMSLHKAGDTVLVLNNGRFSARWGAMLTKIGVNVINAAIAMSQSFSIKDITALEDLSNISGVWITHCETSTGALNSLHSLITTIKQKTDALICVDGISSVGIQDCRMDEWEIDALVSCSQKGLMAPPGLGFVALSRRAWNLAEHSTSDTYYFDLWKARESLEKNLTLFTPAVSLLMGMDAALHLIQKEGLEAIYARHADNAALMRDSLTSMGFELFPQHPSNALTVIKTPHAKQIINELKLKHRIIVAAGQDTLHDEIIRIGHMGYYFRHTIMEFIAAFKDVVSNLQIRQ